MEYHMIVIFYSASSSRTVNCVHSFPSTVLIYTDTLSRLVQSRVRLVRYINKLIQDQANLVYWCMKLVCLYIKLFYLMYWYINVSYNFLKWSMKWNVLKDLSEKNFRKLWTKWIKYNYKALTSNSFHLSTATVVSLCQSQSSLLTSTKQRPDSFG